MSLAVLISAAVLQSSSPAILKDRSQWSVVNINGRRYLFPGDRRETWQLWGTAAHIEMPGWFWHSILSQVGRVDGWQRAADWRVAYLTEPKEPFNWDEPSVPFGPPVSEEVKLEEVRGAMQLWGSQGQSGSQDLVLVTYKGHPDIYVKCDRKAVGRSTKTCDLNWFDVGVIHRLGLAGNWLDKAPAVVERYAAAVKTR